jgi:sulfite exporter TauE/SafE
VDFLATGTLTIAAFWIGLTHTLLGPDHYVPFVALARSRGWSLRTTLLVTLLCGVGHVGSSVLLGLFGLAGGILLQSLMAAEATRGDWAAWLLIGFGLAYTTWGLSRALRGLPHTHLHGHADGTWHVHEHSHEAEHLHVHDQATAVVTGGQSPANACNPGQPRASISASRGEATPWVLFVVFLFGPCEPLIPLLIYPAAEHSYWSAALVAVVFSLVTLVTMALAVVVLLQGTSVLSLRRLDRFSHALAGVAILACGVTVKLGG